MEGRRKGREKGEVWRREGIIQRRGRRGMDERRNDGWRGEERGDEKGKTLKRGIIWRDVNEGTGWKEGSEMD